MSKSKGGFTLPGESGYEKLTLKLAEKWGADTIRDSDGTVLSDEILQAGYDIYSTICIIREHNDWAKANSSKLQQTFLCTPPVIAMSDTLTISLLDSFFPDQFMINDSPAAMKYWQVYDRTLNVPLELSNICYDKGTVVLRNITSFHKYTVSFLAYRIWEEISMYNHTTNHWEKEHLMQIDPRYPETRTYMRDYLHKWCADRPETNVVRFTSMFYNFVWIWGSDERNRHLFTDWASYDFAVSDLALDAFADRYGYSLTAEDFVNCGNYQATHMPPSQAKRDFMEFVHDFTVDFGKELVEIVHEYGKKAYVFYDDSWVGLEPYGPRFHEIGFDGLIKCVFSGYEARLCAAVDIPIHELRLHPYLFPVGLGGAPTFMAGGDPALDTKIYWNRVRRALLFAPIERIGLGGYLHLVEDYPDFCDYVEKIADEFRLLKELHENGKPYLIKPRIAILHCWGRLRSWTLSGHFHETEWHDLIHVIEALSGLPIDVSFISFDDINDGALKNFDIIINAGRAGDAWSGGDAWKDAAIVRLLTNWVNDGGSFIGINQPSAVAGYDTFFRMAHVLGVDQDTGARVCHGKWNFAVMDYLEIASEGVQISSKENCYLTDGKAKVLMAKGNNPLLIINEFGKGKGIYLSSFSIGAANTRLLFRLLCYAGGEDSKGLYLTDNLYVESAYYPDTKQLVAINNSDTEQAARIRTKEAVIQLKMAAYETKFVDGVV